MKPATVERLFWYSGWLYDFSKIAVSLLLIGAIVHFFFFSVLVIRGQSMTPTYSEGDVALVNRLSYWLRPPSRGDVVGMHFPGETESRFVKRVIGLPGETVKISGGKVYINGQVLDEPYLSDGTRTTDDERVLGIDEYYVLGDNRGNSSDSRAWGPVPRTFIHGRASRPLFQLP